MILLVSLCIIRRVGSAVSLYHPSYSVSSSCFISCKHKLRNIWHGWWTKSRPINITAFSFNAYWNWSTFTPTSTSDKLAVTWIRSPCSFKRFNELWTVCSCCCYTLQVCNKSWARGWDWRSSIIKIAILQPPPITDYQWLNSLVYQ